MKRALQQSIEAAIFVALLVVLLSGCGEGAAHSYEVRGLRVEADRPLNVAKLEQWVGMADEAFGELGLEMPRGITVELLDEQELELMGEPVFGIYDGIVRRVYLSRDGQGLLHELLHPADGSILTPLHAGWMERGWHQRSDAFKFEVFRAFGPNFLEAVSQ
jgi:hypothetical protein